MRAKLLAGRLCFDALWLAVLLELLFPKAVVLRTLDREVFDFDWVFCSGLFLFGVALAFLLREFDRTACSSRI